MFKHQKKSMSENILDINTFLGQDFADVDLIRVFNKNEK